MDKKPISESWWKSALIYHVYPLSFKDSNADGIGDLRGITEKLDYLESLNIDCVYINPICPSGMTDDGYDITDYFSIDPRFGTMEDFLDLRDACQDRGMRFMIDYVPGHTSEQHPCFLASVDPNHPEHEKYKDWYVWHKGDEANPPNNWKSYFNGSAWTFNEERQAYYMHQFASSQPNLNLDNADVRDYLCEVFEYWADLGVDIRLDAVGFMGPRKDLKDTSDRLVHPRKGYLNTKAIAANPDGVHHDSEIATFHLSQINRPESMRFLERLRKIADEKGIIMLSEVVVADNSLQMGKRFMRSHQGVDRSHLVYSGAHLREEAISHVAMSKLLKNIELYFPEGGLCHVAGNHDFTRLKTRLFESDTSPEIVVPYIKFLSGLPGPYMHYYGDELGIPQGDVVVRDREPDPAHRDGCRAPMPWDNTKPNGGFSDAQPDALYFSYPEEYDHYAVNKQEENPESVLNQIREVYKQRGENEILRNGDFVVLDMIEAPLIGYARSHEGATIVCILNTSDQTVYSQVMEQEVRPYDCCMMESKELEYLNSLMVMTIEETKSLS